MFVPKVNIIATDSKPYLVKKLSTCCVFNLQKVHFQQNIHWEDMQCKRERWEGGEGRKRRGRERAETYVNTRQHNTPYNTTPKQNINLSCIMQYLRMTDQKCNLTYSSWLCILRFFGSYVKYHSAEDHTDKNEYTAYHLSLKCIQNNV